MRDASRSHVVSILAIFMPGLIRSGQPLRPIFPGFLINTLFYAVIWFTFIFGGRACMRVIRRRWGRCPECGWDREETFHSKP